MKIAIWRRVTNASGQYTGGTNGGFRRSRP